MNTRQVALFISQLTDTRQDVRRAAVQGLARIGTPAIAGLVEALQNEDMFVRRKAAEALKDIGDPAAVPALVKALTDGDHYVRWIAVLALGRFGDDPAVPALTATLRDTVKDVGCVYAVRGYAAKALGTIGDACAVPALIATLKDNDASVRGHVSNALREIGNPVTLPRKILACSRLSAKQRVELLELLQKVYYVGDDGIWHYTLQDTYALCRTVLKEQNADGRKGAQTVLDWLNGERHLLIASHSDTSTKPQELLRAAVGAGSETQANSLLIPAEEP